MIGLSTLQVSVHEMEWQMEGKGEGVVKGGWMVMNSYSLTPLHWKLFLQKSDGSPCQTEEDLKASLKIIVNT